VTGDLPRLGLRLHGGLAPQASIELATLAEEAGFDSLWFAENPFARSALPAASACAAVTGRVAIGLGIVNPYTRHPALIAMEAGALDELAGGRARLGLGSGIGDAVRRMGLGYDRPLSAVREAIHIVRALLRGEMVTFAGRVFRIEAVRLGYRPPRADLPIAMAAMGDRGIALAGDIADLLLVSNLCPLGYTRRAAAILGDAAARAGRAAPAIVQYVPCVPLPDGEAARRLARHGLGETLAALWPRTEPWPPWRETIVRESGIPRAEFAAALARLRAGEAPEAVLDDRWVAAFAIAGTATECLDQARAYRAAGAGELALSFIGPEPRAEIAHLAAALGSVALTTKIK
jgi:5,10-methylenetetrahydromethanopterin reductase